MKKRIFILTLLLAVGLFIARNGFSAKAKSGDEMYGELELFTEALSVVKSGYADELKTKDIIYGALKGMLSSLDPHSQFLPPDDYNEIKVETEGEFGGIGIEITIKDGLLTVISPIDGTPAWKAGLKPNDKIVKINGDITRDITLMDAVKKLRGKAGTRVNVTILREGEEKLLDFVIARDIIKIQSIKDKRLLEGKIGYIKLVEFRQNTPQDLEEAITEIEKQGMDSLILDLRNNPGGLLDVSVDVASKLIEPGQIVVSTRGRMRNQNIEFKAHGVKSRTVYPLVILINEGSASASEIVAGAIQDNKRGIILGKKSFGKASVQTIIPLKDGSALRLTTGRYFTPQGRSIHGEGIIPDVVVDEQIIVAKEPQESISKEVFEKVENHSAVNKPKDEAMPYDAQLSRAVDLLKGIKVYRSLKQ